LVELLKVNLRKGDSVERPVNIEEKSVSSITQALVTTEVHIQTPKNGLRADHLCSFELVKDKDRYWIVEVIDDMTYPANLQSTR
jgi:hypothetical protein